MAEYDSLILNDNNKQKQQQQQQIFMTSVVSFRIADKLNLYLNGLTIEWLNYQSTYHLPILVSTETAVPRRWESEAPKFGIKQDKIASKIRFKFLP